MTLRDLKPNILKRLAMEGEDEFDKWFRNTGGMKFGKPESVDPKDIWRLAYSKGASAILRRVDALKED